MKNAIGILTEIALLDCLGWYSHLTILFLAIHLCSVSFHLLCCLQLLSSMSSSVLSFCSLFLFSLTSFHLSIICSVGLTLCDPKDCSLPGSSVRGTLLARTLDWLHFPPPGDLVNPETEPVLLALQADSLQFEPSGKPFYLFK